MLCDILTMEFLMSYVMDVLTATVVGLLVPSVLLAGYIWWCDRSNKKNLK